MIGYYNARMIIYLQDYKAIVIDKINVDHVEYINRIVDVYIDEKMYKFIYYDDGIYLEYVGLGYFVD